jgi:hypothetical protein
VSNPQGSSWRRWDPHVHFPGTLRNDQFQGTTVEQALQILAAREPRIEAVGVTDYCTTDLFRRVLAAWHAGAGQPISLLFVNVELRLDIPTTKQSPVNIHLLCAAEEVDNLDRFLGLLSFTSAGRRFSATRAGLIDLGRSFRRDPKLDEDSALGIGALQFKVNFDELQDTFFNDSWARESCLVAVPGGEKDGASGVRAADGSFEARRQSIEAFAHIVFSGSGKQAEYWLGRGRDSLAELEQIYRGPKPCLHGCDAHDEASLGVPKLDRFTWLKGDPSFETLRMACLAPDSRALIGPVLPTIGRGPARITRLSVTGANWFAPSTVALNPGLVAIIGARGSGKTALLDVVAVGAGCDAPFSTPASFVVRAGALLRGCSVEVGWSDGRTLTNELAPPGPQDPAGEYAVRYLSQQFVEKLCAADGVSDELLLEIERVVFNAWPVEDRQGASRFQDLLHIRLEGARARQQGELTTIAHTSEEISEQRQLRRTLPKKLRERQAEEGNLPELQKQVVELTGQATSGAASRLAAVTQALTSQQREAQAISRRLTALDALLTAVRVARQSTFPQMAAEYRSKYAPADLSTTEWATFEPTFPGDVDTVIVQAVARARAAQSTTVGEAGAQLAAATLDDVAAEDLPRRTVVELRAECRRLQSSVGLDATRARQLQQASEGVARVQTRIGVLNDEIALASGADQRISELETMRATAYVAYFDALLEEESELRDLYRPLSELIATSTGSVARLRFSVQRDVGVDEWARRGEALLDLRTAGAFHGVGELAKVARTELLPAWEAGDGTRAAEAVKGFSQTYSESLRQQGNVRGDDLQARREWDRRISRWLYSADHIRLRYRLEYDGVDIALLSPGTRGIVLLLLYLAIDQDESVPLIVDQPEENLDPESVYTELVGLFRRASERRQVIMVTHNANLVVNTDVDQVVVAHISAMQPGGLPRLEYTSGGLENASIRKAVCDILEGGEEAFRQRARRLRVRIGG